MFSKHEVEKLLEQAYLNGVSDSAISRIQTGSSVSNIDFKKSTAYYEYLQLIIKKEKQ
jgi:hypothetical protein